MAGCGYKQLNAYVWLDVGIDNSRFIYGWMWVYTVKCICMAGYEYIQLNVYVWLDVGIYS